MESPRRHNLLTAACVLILAGCTLSWAQTNKTPNKEAAKSDEFGLALVRFIDLPGDKHRLVVDLSAPQDLSFAIGDSTVATFTGSDLNAANITIKFLPSGKVFPSSLINNASNAIDVPDTENLSGFGGTRLQIGIVELADTSPEKPKSTPDPGDDKVEVTFAVLHFMGKTVMNVSGTGRIYNRGNIADRVEETRQVLSDAVAHAKTDEEKDAFIGLNVVVPAGGDSQGSGDISFNRDLYAASLGQAALFDRVKVGFHLNKASEENSDPRHLDFGLTLRKTFLRADRAKLDSIKNAINRGTSSPLESDTVVQDISALQKDFIRAFIFDNAFRFEGDVSTQGISNVSNLLWDTQLQVATVSRALIGNTGFWNFRWVPAGFELGSNLNNNDNPAQGTSSLARGKTGGEFNLIFKAGSPNEPVSRIQFSAKALERYLFRDENVLDPVTNLVVLTDKGSKYWLQADLKVGTGIQAGPGRVGFRLSFQRGYMPPVYNYVRTFNVGIVFETNDDDSSKNMKVK